MARLRAGKQLQNRQRDTELEARRRQTQLRAREQRRESTKKLTKRAILVLCLVVVGLILFDRQTIRYRLADDDLRTYGPTIDSYLSENILRKSKLFFDPDNLEAFIQKSHPNVQSVKIQTSFFSDYDIELELKQPAFLWQSGEDRFIGDTTGTIYAILNNRGFDEALQFKDAANLPINIGDTVLSPLLLNLSSELSNELPRAGYNVSYFQIPESSREIHVFPDGESYFIKISLDRSVAGQVDELVAVKDFLKANKITPKQYIDVRVVDKAFYR